MFPSPPKPGGSQVLFHMINVIKFCLYKHFTNPWLQLGTWDTICLILAPRLRNFLSWVFPCPLSDGLLFHSVQNEQKSFCFALLIFWWCGVPFTWWKGNMLISILREIIEGIAWPFKIWSLRKNWTGLEWERHMCKQICVSK